MTSGYIFKKLLLNGLKSQLEKDLEKIFNQLKKINYKALPTEFHQ